MPFADGPLAQVAARIDVAFRFVKAGRDVLLVAVGELERYSRATA